MTKGVAADTNRIVLAAAGAVLIGAFFFGWGAGFTGHNVAQGKLGLTYGSLFYSIPIMGLILVGVAVPGPPFLRTIAAVAGLGTLGLLSYLWGFEYTRILRWGFYLVLAGAAATTIMLISQVPAKALAAPAAVMIGGFFAPWATLPTAEGTTLTMTGLKIAREAPFNTFFNGCLWLIPVLGATLVGTSLSKSSWGALNAMVLAGIVLGPVISYPARTMIEHGQMGVFATAGAALLALTLAPTRG